MSKLRGGRHARRAKSSEGGPDDPSLHGNAHEIGHLWWGAADVFADDDWINEALAEYSAWRDSRRRGGRALGRVWLAAYGRELHDKAPPRGILGTHSSDTFRHANWYERGAAFFACAEAMVGEEALLTALRRLRGISASRAVVTADVIESLAISGVDERWMRHFLEDAKLEAVDTCILRSAGEAS